MNLKLHFLKSHLQHFPENLGDYNKEQGKRFHQVIEPDPQRNEAPKGSAIKEDGISIWQTFVGCWRGNMWWRAESVKEIRYIGHSKIKRFAKARDLEGKPKHTLIEKILHLRSYILIEVTSPIEIPQFTFIEFPESRGYTTEGLLFKAWEI